MTSNMHWVYQILTLILHGVNLFGGVVPTKYQAIVAFVLALVNAGLGLYNHYFTPAGARIVAAFLLALFLGASAQAQTVTTAPAPQPTQHFTLSGSVVSYMGPGGTAPASIADGYFNLTKNFSVGYQQITIPTIATAKLGVLDYGKPLSAWLGKTLSAKFVFDTSKVSLDVFGGAGKLNESALNVNRIAETAGACVSYSLGTNVSANLVCGQWLHGGIVNGFITNGSLPGTPATPQSNSAAISSGLKVHF